jgi:hypothetical protein
MPEFRKLTHLLDHLLNAAYQQRNVHQKETLPGGLTIELYITAHTAQPAVIHLKLSRTGIPPSAKEAETVFKHWPWELEGGAPAWNSFKTAKVYSMTTHFDLPDVRNHFAGLKKPLPEADDED